MYTNLDLVYDLCQYSMYICWCDNCTLDEKKARLNGV